MAKNAIDWVWEHSCSVNAARIVLLALAHEANRDGEAEMSDTELAAKCRLAERTVRAAVGDLVLAGEIHAARGTARGHPTRYRMITETPAKSAAVEPLTPAKSAAVPEPRQNLPQLEPRQNLPQLTHVGAGQNTTPAKSAAVEPPLEKTTMLVRSTGISEVPLNDVSAILRPDVEAACRHLADCIEANGSKRPVITKRWRDAARLMLDKDGRTERQLSAAIEWCQSDEFWRANILSMPKLREKYDQLRLQASRSSRKPGRQAEVDEQFKRQMKRAQEKENGIDSHRNGNPDPLRQSALPSPAHR